jgi:hypothetical protein
MEICTTMNPSDIQLESTTKMFEYEKISREIDGLDDLDSLKNMLRCYVKLHMKQQETIVNLMPGFSSL